MTSAMRILVVEDDDDTFDTYKDTVDELVEDGRKIELVRKESANDALFALLSKDFDGAIVDLNLNPNDSSESTGNDVLAEILQKHRFPVFVVSGNIQNLREDIRKKESDFLRFFNKDSNTSNKTIFRHLTDIYDTGITNILGGRGLIERHIGEIFWGHLAQDFSALSKGELISERRLLRYNVSHLLEYLDISEKEEYHYHEAEFYIRPPIRAHIAPGDIVEANEADKVTRFLVLSPACDIAVRGLDGPTPIINANMIMLAPIIPINRSAFLEREIIHPGDNSAKREKKLSEIVKSKAEKFAFLPEYADIYPGVVDFQNIHTWSLDKFLEAKRIATVANSFLKDIQSRFSSYVGRQGQPDLNKKEIIKRLKGNLKPEDQ
ncbi:response regulator [Microbulbifer thermotolerans]|uniref:response regulator n=1 Tax=Microbulbifer thermotolerans TaxID=252514 RepID=UPI0011142066|nr:response regulator [Microbulbifer thermotolerans]